MTKTRCVLCIAGAVVSAVLAGQAHAAEPDMTGIWQAMNPTAALKPVRGAVPFKPEAKAAYAKTSAASAAGNTDFDETKHCLPPGLPRIFGAGHPFEIIQRPFQIAFLFQYQSLYRTVLMTDAQPEVLLRAFMGQAVGHWEGRDLVIDSVGFKPNFFLDDLGMPHGDKLHIVERLHLESDAKTLVNDVRIEDPDTFTHSWEARYTFTRRDDARIQEDICADRATVLHR